MIKVYKLLKQNSEQSNGLCRRGRGFTKESECLSHREYSRCTTTWSRRKALLDPSHALDTIDHQSFGIRGVALEWFGSYREDRTKTVQIGPCKSITVALTYGVHQGSVLGLISFTMYTITKTRLNNSYWCWLFYEVKYFGVHRIDFQSQSEVIYCSKDASLFLRE